MHPSADGGRRGGATLLARGATEETINNSSSNNIQYVQQQRLLLESQTFHMAQIDQTSVGVLPSLPPEGKQLIIGPRNSGAIDGVSKTEKIPAGGQLVEQQDFAKKGVSVEEHYFSEFDYNVEKKDHPAL